MTKENPVPKDSSCWFCRRTEKDIKKFLKNCNYKKDQDGLRWTGVTMHNMIICGNCEDIIMDISVDSYRNLKEGEKANGESTQ